MQHPCSCSATESRQAPAALHLLLLDDVCRALHAIFGDKCAACGQALLPLLTCAATSSALLWTFSCHVKVRDSCVNC
jgi:hypothetical protein